MRQTGLAIWISVHNDSYTNENEGRKGVECFINNITVALNRIYSEISHVCFGWLKMTQKKSFINWLLHRSEYIVTISLQVLYFNKLILNHLHSYRRNAQTITPPCFTISATLYIQKTYTNLTWTFYSSTTLDKSFSLSFALQTMQILAFFYFSVPLFLLHDKMHLRPSEWVNLTLALTLALDVSLTPPPAPCVSPG